MPVSPHRSIVVAAPIVVALLLTSCASSPEPLACDDVPGLMVEGVQILAVEEIPAGDLGRAHCKITGVADRAINFELLLPEDWNGKFLMGGGGGFVGSVQNWALGLGAGVGPLDRGYATVGTDTGHSGSGIDASWALDDLEALENFAYRAVHRTAEASKAIIGGYYAADPSRSYFMGCSRGGGQGMIEAQRYPNDFDGIVSLAPAMSWSGVGAGMVQTQQAIYPDPAELSSPLITDENRALLARELAATCDAQDGLEDGILDDPRRCALRPEELPRCPGDQPGAECVTAAQLGAIQVVYGGAIVNGETVFPGFPFGGENDNGGWDAWVTGSENAFGPGTPSLHFAFGTQMYKYFTFNDPDWDYATYDFATWAEDIAPTASLLDATDADLSAFSGSGGKLIMAHGWSDPALTALYSVQYYEEAEALDAAQRDYFRLFMMPGMLHCGGGPGPDRVDWIAALEGWVEEGEAPDRLLASKLDANGATMMTRPLCPYPQVAIYDGSGDPNVAASFSCGMRGER